MSIELIVGLFMICAASSMPFILDYRFQKRREEVEALHGKYTDKITEITDGFLNTMVEVVTEKDKKISDTIRTFGEMLLAKSAMDRASAQEKIIKAEKGESEKADPINRPFDKIHGMRKAFKDAYGPMMRTPVATVRPGTDPMADKRMMERKAKELEREQSEEFAVRQ